MKQKLNTSVSGVEQEARGVSKNIVLLHLNTDTYKAALEIAARQQRLYIPVDMANVKFFTLKKNNNFTLISVWV